jgi:hypothetical protein
MLQNAVFPVMELCPIKEADQHKVLTGKDLTYVGYADLLLSAAASYDLQFAPKTFAGSRHPLRAVYSHDITEFNDADGDFVFDIDCGIDVIRAYAHASANGRPPGTTRPPGTSMPFSKWT